LVIEGFAGTAAAAGAAMLAGNAEAVDEPVSTPCAIALTAYRRHPQTSKCALLAKWAPARRNGRSEEVNKSEPSMP
jgi:hypothetical protein